MQTFKNLKDYNYILFDCDGVVLNSNKIKSDSFFNIAMRYDEESALELVKYNKMNGGISRFKKFEYYIYKILPKYQNYDLDSKKLARDFGKEVKKGLLNCEISPHIFDLKKKYQNTKWAIISGGKQSELRDVFYQRSLIKLFEMGVWGSPENKYQIIKNNFNHIIGTNVLYLGDSKLDYDVACYYKFDFIFVSDWTELACWKEFIKMNSICTIKNIGKLIDE